MSVWDAVGYLASMLVIASFGMRAMVPLRVLAVCSNLAFFAYGLGLRLAPVLRAARHLAADERVALVADPLVRRRRFRAVSGPGVVSRAGRGTGSGRDRRNRHVSRRFCHRARCAAYPTSGNRGDSFRSYCGPGVAAPSATTFPRSRPNADLSVLAKRKFSEHLSRQPTRSSRAAASY